MTELAWLDAVILTGSLPLLVLFARLCRATPRTAFCILFALVPWTFTAEIGFLSLAASEGGAGPALALPLEPLMAVFAILMVTELLFGRTSANPDVGVA